VASQRNYAEEIARFALAADCENRYLAASLLKLLKPSIIWKSGTAVPLRLDVGDSPPVVPMRVVGFGPPRACYASTRSADRVRVSVISCDDLTRRTICFAFEEQAEPPFPDM